jgi:hypothetical protein
MDRLDVLRLGAIVTERFAQQANHLEQRRFRNERVPPRRVEQCLLRDDRPGVGHERGENAERAWRQRHLDARPPQPVLGVELERTERNRQNFRLSSGNLQDVACAPWDQL